MAASKVDLLSNDTLPIGCLKIELDSGLGSCFNAGNNPLDVVADMFAMPISFAHIYLVLLIIHTVLQLQPEYNSCAYMFVYFGAITWLFSCVQFALLLSHWEEFWRCSNFRPYWPSVISIGLVVSFLMFFCCVFELLYNPELMHSGGKKKPAANISNYNNGTKKPGALDYNKDQGSLGTATS